MTKPKVIISVLNWNNYEDTILCIRSVLESDYPKYEIVIVDNNSTNNSVDQIKNAYPELRLIRSNHNHGYAGGHALAVEYAIGEKADAIWILNNDSTVYVNTLSKLVDAYNRHGRAVYGSISLKSENPDVINYGGGEKYKDEYQEFSYNIFEDQLLNECVDKLVEREVQSVEGSSLLIPLSIIKAYGFMDESYFMYGEETIYCYRLRVHNIPSIVVPASVILHKGASSFSGDDEIGFIASYYRRRNFIFFMKQFYGWSNKGIIKRYGGLIGLLKQLAGHHLSANGNTEEDRINYYINLATIHALIGNKGKTVDPEKFIKKR